MAAITRYWIWVSLVFLRVQSGLPRLIRGERFRWATDNMLIQGLSLSLTPIALEFNPARVSYLVVAYGSRPRL
jgi:hypothetical protein